MTSSIIENLAVILASIASVAAITASIFTAISNKKMAQIAKDQNEIKLKAEKEANHIRESEKMILHELENFKNQLFNQASKFILPQISGFPTNSRIIKDTEHGFSFFDTRRGHFSIEKKVLCEKFVNELASRLLKNNELNIVLILDAGSTVYPIFELLCKHPKFKFDFHFSERVTIVTNNLPGVSSLSKYGRIGDSKVPKPLFKSKVLGGFTHTGYEATLGAETSLDLKKSVKLIKEKLIENQKKVEIICVTTGNYISIKEGPLARNNYHLEIKEMMLDLSDFAFVLSPLGKFLPFSIDNINQNLLSIPEGEQDYKYKKLSNWNEYKNKVILFTTFRPDDYIKHFEETKVGTYFQKIQIEVESEFQNGIYNVNFNPFNDLTIRAQSAILGPSLALEEYEFPHKGIKEKILEYLNKKRGINTKENDIFDKSNTIEKLIPAANKVQNVHSR